MTFGTNDPPSWMKRVLERAGRADGEHMRVERRAGDEGSPAISLGAGMFVAPLPVDWSLHPSRPFEGRIRVKEGYDIHYRIDSHEDAEAAAGGPRLLAYASEPELRGMIESPRDVVSDIMISLPDRDAEGREILWKWVEPMCASWCCVARS